MTTNSNHLQQAAQRGFLAGLSADSPEAAAWRQQCIAEHRPFVLARNDRLEIDMSTLGDSVLNVRGINLVLRGFIQLVPDLPKWGDIIVRFDGRDDPILDAEMLPDATTTMVCTGFPGTSIIALAASVVTVLRDDRNLSPRKLAA